MFSAKISQILQILLVFICLLVIRQFPLVLLFRRGGLCLIIRLLLWRQKLPVLADELGDLGEAQILALEVLTRLFKRPVSQRGADVYWAP